MGANAGLGCLQCHYVLRPRVHLGGKWRYWLHLIRNIGHATCDDSTDESISMTSTILHALQVVQMRTYTPRIDKILLALIQLILARDFAKI